MIRVYHCGTDSQHTRPCNIHHPSGLDTYLFLLIKSDAWFYINNEKVSTKANMAILFPPNVPIHYGSDSRGFNDDWIRLSLMEEDLSSIKTLGLKISQPMYPLDVQKLSQYLRLLVGAIYNPSIHIDTIADSLMKAFFHSLSEEITRTGDLRDSTSKYYPTLSQLRTRLYNRPTEDWKVTDMASKATLSVSYFQHLYKDFFGCSCQQDIIEARLLFAEHYLRTSIITVKELAYFCGYNNELHFMRQFKKYRGQTPSQYRKSHRT